MKTLIISLIELILLLQFSLQAQSSLWIVYDTTNSPLTTNIIKTVENDRVGNIWIGTEDGLYKYDGYLWAYYNTSNSGIPYNNMRTLTIHKYNNLWFNVSNNPYPYFVKFDGSEWTVIDTNQTCFTSNFKFTVDSYETKWISSPNLTITRYDGFGCTVFTELDIGINLEMILDMEIDDDDNFWLCTDGTIPPGQLDPGIAKTTENGWVHNTLYSSLSLARDTLNQITWVAGMVNIWKLNSDNLFTLDSFDNPSSYTMEELEVDRYGNVWGRGTPWSSQPPGLFVFNVSASSWDKYTFENSDLPSGNIYSLAIDFLNNKWIGTKNGLAIFNAEGIVLPESLTSSDTLNFGYIPVNESLTLQFTFFNPYNENLIIDSVLIEPDGTFSSFVLLPVTIVPNDSAIFDITFHPAIESDFESKINLYSNHGAKTVLLIGTSIKTVNVTLPYVLNNQYILSNNYPNPFNPKTKLKYQIPKLNFVTIKVYDALGNEIATLVNEEKPAGEYEVEFNAADLTSGIYFYQLRAGNFTGIKKMIILK